MRLFATVVVCLLGMLLSGCSQPGETATEVGRRHDRILRLNSQMVLSDVDRTLLLDRPTRLTDKRLP